MDYSDEENIWKKFYRRQWWLGWFFIIPFIVYLLIIEIIKSFNLAIVLSIISFLIWTLIFFLSGIYKDI
jgi:membrane-anchored protein YejM (alkaline phosphatase superfamily)